MQKSSRADLSKLTPYVLFAILVLLTVDLQAIRTSKLPYTPVEDWFVYGTPISTPANPIYTADNLPSDFWIYLFGSAPPVTRYLSTLLNGLCFAFIFRLCSDLWDKEVALTAIVLLGTLAVANNLSWMAQPYAALFMIVPGLLLLWSRWLYRPTLKISALYLVFAVAGVYSCTFSILFIFAQIGFLLVFVKDRQLCTRSLALFAVVVTVCLPRLLALTNSNPQFGLPFSSWSAIDLLRVPISISPLEFLQLIILLALATTATSFVQPPEGNNSIQLRWNASWPTAYLLTIILTFLVLIGLLSGMSIGSLYSIGILPILAILGARALWSLSGVVRGAILIMSLALVLAAFRNPIPGIPYQNVVEQAVLSNANDRLVIAAPYIWQHLPFVHYAPDRSFHILPGPVGDSAELIPAIVTAHQYDADSVERFNQFINHAPQVWLYVENLSDDQLMNFPALMTQNYDEVSPNQRSWYDNQGPDYGELRKFIRIPDDSSIMFVFEDQLTLRAWSIRQSVQVFPCEWITVQSWWAATRSISSNLSMTLVMVNSKDGQGIARADGSPTGRETTTLIPEAMHVDERSIQVPCDAQPGEYPLLIGIYEVQNQSIRRLMASLPSGAPLGNLAYLTTLFINS
jgi:hypothetical protein